MAPPAIDAWPIAWQLGLLVGCILLWRGPARRWRPAGKAFLLTLTLAALIGEQHPVTRLPMYSVVAADDHLYVPAFQADGQDARPGDFDRYSGLDGRLLDPPPVPLSATWYRDEMSAHVERSRASEAGPVVITVGYRKLSIVEGEAVTGPVVPVASGHAWRAE